MYADEDGDFIFESFLATDFDKNTGKLYNISIVFRLNLLIMTD